MPRRRLRAVESASELNRIRPARRTLRHRTTRRRCRLGEGTWDSPHDTMITTQCFAGRIVGCFSPFFALEPTSAKRKLIPIV